MRQIDLTATARLGAHLDWAIRDTLEIAWLSNQPVTLVFNGVKLEIAPCSTVAELRAFYSRQTEDRR
jgi:hypothetical protein